MAYDAYFPIATVAPLTSPTGTFSFTSIPSTYTDLFIVFDGFCHSSAMGDIIQFNGDTAGNYSFVGIDNYGSSITGSANSNTTSITIGTSNDGRRGIGTVNIMQYTNTNIYKTAVSSNWGDTSYKTNTVTGIWRSTSAITSINISNDSGRQYAVGSSATLYGILAAV